MNPKAAPYFHLYRDECIHYFRAIEPLLHSASSHSEELIRHLHSIKGMAKALMLEEHVDAVHFFEGFILAQRWSDLPKEFNHLKTLITDWTKKLPQHVETTPVLSDYLNLLEERARSKGVSVLIHQDIEVPRELESKLLTWLSILLDNSLLHAFTPKTPSPTFTISGQSVDGTWTLTTEDNGQGFVLAPILAQLPAEFRKRISRIQEKTKWDSRDLQLLLEAVCLYRISSGSGRGVGLESLRAEIAQLKGQFDLDYTGPLGTRFKIQIPVSQLKI